MEFNTTDTSELSDEERVRLAERFLGEEDGGLGHIAKLKHDAILGRFDGTPRTVTSEFHGDDHEEALGRAYGIRDTIEKHSDATVDCELTGEAYLLPSTTFYEVALHINQET
jgi:hypothetical protein